MITFGRFGHIEDKKEEKKRFLENLNVLMDDLNFGYIYGERKEEKRKEIEIIKPLKDMLKRLEKSYFNSWYIGALCSFLEKMGLSYYKFTQIEKENVLDMDFTYENWEKKSIELITNFIKRIKNACHPIVSFCFDDIYFVFHIQICYQNDFKVKDLSTYIRDYYILDDTSSLIMDSRNPEKYKEIQRKAIEMYPIIKERLGMSRTYEKFLYFIGVQTDYNYPKAKNILDNYYNNKKNNNFGEDDELNLLKYKKD